MEINLYTYSEGSTKVDVSISSDVFLNITEIYKNFGKKQSTFNSFVNGPLTNYAQKLIDLGKISNNEKIVIDDTQTVTVEDLISTSKGGADIPGTWIHPKLILKFARWISDEFEIWCDEKIDELLKKGYVGITDEVTDLLTDKVDSLPLLKDKIKKAAKGKQVQLKALFTKVVEEAASNYMDFSPIIIEISKSAGTAMRLEIYERMLSDLDTAIGESSIRQPFKEEYRLIVHDRTKTLLKRRYNASIKREEENEKAIADLKLTNEQLYKAANAVSTVDPELSKDNKKLTKLLARMTDITNNPIIDDTIRENNYDLDIKDIVESIKLHEGTTMYMGGGIAMMAVNKGGEKSGNGNIPNYKSHSGTTEAVLWLNSNGSAGGNLRIVNSSTGERYINRIDIAPDPEQPHVWKGTYTKGKRTYHVIIHEATMRLIIYTHSYVV